MKPIAEDLVRKLEKARSNGKYLKKLKQKLSKMKPKELDPLFQGLHEEVFEEVDCLECANCCKTTSPIFRDTDIERLAKHLRMKASEFTKKYLYLDDDHDYVLNTAPCPFLGDDLYCTVYESRPKACKEYPHTDRKNMSQILNLTVKNTQVCPAVGEIMERIKLGL
ncbi:MAG: YkgJ family cysteine cluster protein [Flavobacteriales bacterium]